MASVWHYRPKDLKVKSVVVEGIKVTQDLGVKSVGKPNKKLNKWVGKLLRVAMLPNAGKTQQDIKQEVKKTVAAKAADQIDKGPPPTEHAKYPDLGNLDAPMFATKAELETMDFGKLREYAKTNGVQTARGKHATLKAIIDAGKVRSA